MATQAAPAPREGRLRKVPRPPSVDAPSRPSSVFEGQNIRSKDYWNNILCLFTGLNSDPSQPAGVTSITNRDYFNDRPSPPRTPILRARSSNTSVNSPRRSSSLLRPSFTAKHSSRSILRRMSARNSGVSFDIKEEPEPPVSPVSPACDPVPEEVMPSAFEADILSTIPGASAEQEMISLERDGRTIWIPQHVVEHYSAASPTPRRLGDAGALKIAIPDRTASRPTKRQQPEEHPRTLTLVGTGSSDASTRQSFESSSPGGSHRSKSSFSGSSVDSPSVRTPDSVYSSDGTSLTSLELQTPTDSSPVGFGHVKDYSVADPSKAGVFDDALTPPPIQPRDPRRASARDATAAIATKDFAPIPTLIQAQGDLGDEQVLIDSASPEAVRKLLNLYEPARDSAPPVPRRSDRRADNEPPRKKLTNRKSVGDMSLAITADDQTADDTRVTSDAAESVIFHILHALYSLPDLFALAQINHGFYAVYRRHQFLLVKSTLRNDCPAAWQFRELCGAEDMAGLSADASESQRTKRYIEALRRDAETLGELKNAILERCTSFLRPNTLAALHGDDVEAERALDAALWRIWAFCARFQATPADVESQLEHLRLSGLSADQLYDMTELWNCIAALTSGVLDAPDALQQARAAGIIGPDADHAALEAWLDAQRVRGPAVALELAAVAAEPSADVFAFAAQMGWSAAPDTPAAFLRDAVNRAYSAALAAERAAPAPLEIACPTPLNPARASPLSALEPDGPLDLDESHIHPALRRCGPTDDDAALTARPESRESRGFVTPPTVPSMASSTYSTRPPTPA